MASAIYIRALLKAINEVPGGVGALKNIAPKFDDIYKTQTKNKFLNEEDELNSILKKVQDDKDNIQKRALSEVSPFNSEYGLDYNSPTSIKKNILNPEFGNIDFRLPKNTKNKNEINKYLNDELYNSMKQKDYNDAETYFYEKIQNVSEKNRYGDKDVSLDTMNVYQPILKSFFGAVD